MWDFEMDTVLINGMEVPLDVRETLLELDAGVSNANGRHAASPIWKASQQLTNAEFCAVDGSSLGERQLPCAGTEETEQFLAVARRGIDRLKRQRGGRRRLRAGLGQRGCYRCHEGGHQVRHCPYDRQRGRVDRTAGEQ